MDIGVYDLLDWTAISGELDARGSAVLERLPRRRPAVILQPSIARFRARAACTA